MEIATGDSKKKNDDLKVNCFSWHNKTFHTCALSVTNPNHIFGQASAEIFQTQNHTTSFQTIYSA